jgi:hypothetical protein
MSVKTIQPNDGSFILLAINFSDSSLLRFYSEIDSKLLKRIVSHIGLNVYYINNRNNSYLSANCEYHLKWMKQMSRY